MWNKGCLEVGGVSQGCNLLLNSTAEKEKEKHNQRCIYFT